MAWLMHLLIVDALEGPRVVPKAPTWKGSAISSQFCLWLKDDDGSKKSDKDACQYVKQVEVIFDRAGVEDTRIVPDFSTKIRERFLEPAKADNKKTAPTIKNYLIALTKFVSFGIDIQHFESRQNAQDFKIRVDRWKCSPRKKIAEHNITRKNLKQVS